MLRLRHILTPLRALLRSLPRGTALVEFGLAAPFLILLIVGLVDFGLGFFEYLQVRGAASAGAQYASRHGYDNTICPGSSCPITKAVQHATNLGTLIQLTSGYPLEVCGCPTSAPGFVSLGTTTTLSCPLATYSCSGVANSNCTGSNCPAGLYVVVNAYVDYTPMLPYPGLTGGALALTSSAYRRVQ